MSITTQFVGCSTLVALCALAPGAHAGQPVSGDAPAAPGAVRADAPSAYVPGFGLAAAPERLGRARGGTHTMTASATLRGAVTGNSATDVVTGANSIQTGAFAGASGIPVVIQNSGANVLIQNATVINLQFRQ